MAFRYQMTGPGVANLTRREEDVPAPAPGEVQVRIRASRLNYHDYVTLSGLIPWVEYPRVPLSVFEVMQKNLTFKGVTVGCGESLERMCRFIECHGIWPVISHRLSAAELPRGLQLMESGGHFGKIAIEVE